MAGDIKGKYGASNQTITVTVASLASSATAGRAGTAIDNTANAFLDALVFAHFSIPDAVPANDKAIYIYTYGTCNGGTNYTGGCTGTDAAYTMDDPTVLKLIGVIPIPTQNKIYYGGPFSVAAAFGGVLPDHWGIVVRNYCGQTIVNDANSKAYYQGVLAQYT
jgi:hypothetical protein